MPIKIKNAILHILKNDGSPSVFSANELDIESEVCEAFINKHVKRLMDNPAAREAQFKPDSKLYGITRGVIDGSVNFKEASVQMARRLSEIINKHVDIPSGDLLVVRFEDKSQTYLALLKLNYKECFTHRTAPDGADNQLVKYQAVLPFDSGKVEEACLIPFAPMVLRVLEKPFVVDGEAVCYFSELFLEGETALSKKETVRIISEVTDEFLQEYCSGDVKTGALLKTALIEEAENDEGIISMDNVAAKVFAEAEDVKRQYVEILREAGIKADVPLGTKFTRQQFASQKIKADNGVEIKFPAELAADESVVEFTQHSDGTVTVLFKRLRVQ